MYAVLDHFSDISIIDEFIHSAPKNRRVRKIRACVPMIRKPFIELIVSDNQSVVRQFHKEGFATEWAKAAVIFETLTNIEVISEFDFPACGNLTGLIVEIGEIRNELIEESCRMFDLGMYRQFVNQYGLHYKNLPTDSIKKLKIARQLLDSSP
jgi:hypothetical protein